MAGDEAGDGDVGSDPCPWPPRGVWGAEPEPEPARGTAGGLNWRAPKEQINK